MPQPVRPDGLAIPHLPRCLTKQKDTTTHNTSKYKTYINTTQHMSSAIVMPTYLQTIRTNTRQTAHIGTATSNQQLKHEKQHCKHATQHQTRTQRPRKPSTMQPNNANHQTNKAKYKATTDANKTKQPKPKLKHIDHKPEQPKPKTRTNANKRKQSTPI